MIQKNGPLYTRYIYMNVYFGKAFEKTSSLKWVHVLMWMRIYNGKVEHTRQPLLNGWCQVRIQSVIQTCLVVSPWFICMSFDAKFVLFRQICVVDMSEKNKRRLNGSNNFQICYRFQNIRLRNSIMVSEVRRRGTNLARCAKVMCLFINAVYVCSLKIGICTM